MGKWGEFEFNVPYVGDEIVKICEVTLPSDYVKFMRLHNGGEGDIGETWLVLFPLDELQEVNDGYEIEKYLPGHIIIGSNGSSELYGIDNAGNYFNVPVIFEEDYITLLGTDFNLLPDKINELWR